MFDYTDLPSLRLCQTMLWFRRESDPLLYTYTSDLEYFFGHRLN